ncbi:MAG: ATP-dependent protease subunit HslV [Candidatus Omnitrophota bacterium]|jgi:ATP-dependent HslUV protease subunit HslV|nr:MAG: ATP-dependent protease subunit HslV [Candidatus Omnitrophota bacterium]
MSHGERNKRGEPLLNKYPNAIPPIRATTILSVRRENEVVIAGDGQVSMGDTIMKTTARKVRTMYDGEILAGFAGTSADAFTLFEKFEAKLDEYNGNVTRSAVELAKEWRTDKMLRHLEALLIVCDEEITLVISGTGDVIEPDDGVIAIGSGGPYAQAAAKALMKFTDLPLKTIAEEAMKLAAEICVFTNDHILIESLPNEEEKEEKEKKKNNRNHTK